MLILLPQLSGGRLNARTAFRRKAIMENLKRKKILACLYIIIAGILAFLMVLLLYTIAEVETDYDDSAQKLQSMTDTYEQMLTGLWDADDDFRNDLVITAKLKASAIRTEGIELEPGPFGNGFIVQLTGDGSGRPEGFPDIDITDQEILDRFSQNEAAVFFQQDTDKWMIADKIRGSLYYIEFIPFNETASHPYETVDISTSLDSLAKSIGYDYILLNGEKEDGEYPILASTGLFKDIESTKDLGLRSKEIDGSTLTAIVEKNHLYLVRSFEPKNTEIPYYALMVISLRAIMQRALEQTDAQLFLTLIIWIALSVWILSILSLVKSRKLTLEENRQYNPWSVKRKTALFIASGTIIICISALFFASLESLFLQTNNATLMLEGYFDRMETDQEGAKEWHKISDERYQKNARCIADLLDEFESIRNGEWLQEASDIIGAESITVYGPDGEQDMSSTPLKGLTLGKDESSATYDFNRLLHGVSYLSRDKVKDATTGVTRDLHGVSLGYNASDDAYGAMIISVDPSGRRIQTTDDKSNVASLITCDDEICLGIDPDTGEIIVTSDYDLAGMNRAEIGMADIPLTSTFMGTMNIDGTEYYGVSSQYRNDSLIYYYAEKKSAIYSHVWSFARTSTIVYLILTILLALILLKGFNQQSFEKYSVIETEEELFIHKRSSDAPWWDMFKLFDKEADPFRKALSITQIMLFIAIVAIAITLLRARTTSGQVDTVVEFIAQRRWEYGLNAFAVATVLYTFCALAAVLALLRFLSMMFAGFLSERAQTICLLLINTLHYMSLIVFVFVSLAFLGVNTRAILTSVSLAGLALTFGAQGFIADILAGITTVTDGTYQVGDIVEIGGFRGEVSKLGMRSTTLIGRGKNVRTFRNSSIGDVTNYSRLNSWYGLTLTMPSSVHIDEVEEILKNELPIIAQKNSKIISGPEYRGVESISGDKTTILILTECKQDDYSNVSRLVNREVLRIFTEHDIKLL